jgi:hypothetical protein
VPTAGSNCGSARTDRVIAPQRHGRRLPAVIPKPRRPWRALAAVLAAGAAACGGKPAPEPAPAPADRGLTVVVVVVDSLMPGEISAFSMPNLQALKSGGRVFGAAGGVEVAGGTFYPESRSVFIAETIPNHVAMMTGVNPDRSGIIGNDYLDATLDPPDEVDMGVPEFVTARTLFTWIAERCRDTGANPAIRTGAAMSKRYLHAVFAGDAANPDLPNRDPDVFNLAPDLHFDPTRDPGYLPYPAELTPDSVTMARALEQLPQVDFQFINLGDVDRLAHGSGQTPRAAALLEADTQIGNLVAALHAAGRWRSTVLIVTSDHGMDYTPPTSAGAINTQPLLNDLAGCGFLPMTAAAANGATDLIVVNDADADPEERRRALRAARTCLVGSATDCAALCPGARRPANAAQVAHAWYKADDPLDPAGNMPASVRSRHANMADLVLSPKPGNKFSEPGLSNANSQIPGVHGGPNTLRGTMLVTGGSPWVKKAVVVAPSVASPGDLDRLPEQSETIDVAPTVAWLLGLDLRAADFPDAELGRGFDGRVLSEAFVQFDADPNAAPPSACGRLD